MCFPGYRVNWKERTRRPYRHTHSLARLAAEPSRGLRCKHILLKRAAGVELRIAGSVGTRELQKIPFLQQTLICACRERADPGASNQLSFAAVNTGPRAIPPADPFHRCLPALCKQIDSPSFFHTQNCRESRANRLRAPRDRPVEPWPPSPPALPATATSNRLGPPRGYRCLHHHAGIWWHLHSCSAGKSLSLLHINPCI